jgi:hypothetical protein
LPKLKGKACPARGQNNTAETRNNNHQTTYPQGQPHDSVSAEENNIAGLRGGIVLRRAIFLDLKTTDFRSV